MDNFINPTTDFFEIQLERVSLIPISLFPVSSIPPVGSVVVYYIMEYSLSSLLMAAKIQINS
jgi:hypothetical protein